MAEKKRYGNMVAEPRQEIHYGKEPVWTSPVIDTLRRSECLCYNCTKLKPEDGNECPIASAFYEICKRENVALAVTRCPVFEQSDTPPSF